MPNGLVRVPLRFWRGPLRSSQTGTDDGPWLGQRPLIDGAAKRPRPTRGQIRLKFQLQWRKTKKTHHLRWLTIALGDSVVQVDVILRGLSHGLGVLRLVAQTWVEASFVRHIFNCSNLLPGIDVGKGSSDHSVPIRDFTVRSVDVSIESSCSVGKLIGMMRRRRRCRGQRHLVAVLVQIQVGDIGKGHANCDSQLDGRNEQSLISLTDEEEWPMEY